jgi:CRISPR-associated protein Cmr2
MADFGDALVGSNGFADRLAAAKSARNALLATVGLRPSRYYAIIVADGDKMGDLISGASRPGSSLGPSVHLAITNALSGFALSDAPHIMESVGHGKLVYAGGDDVLALLPVECLMPALDGLYRAFRGTEREPGAFDGFVEDRNGVIGIRMGDATLSAGAVIVHEATPFSHALAEARAAERDAKQVYGRDAFAIRLLKRSGAPVEVGAKWRVAGVNVPLAVADAADLMSARKLSSGVVYDLEASRLEQAGNVWSDAALIRARQLELRRILGRNITVERKAAEEVERELEPLVKLVGVPEISADPNTDSPGWKNSWMAVQGLLRLARMIVEER